MKNAVVRAHSAFPCQSNKVHMRYLQRKVSNRIAELRNDGWDKLLGDLEPNHQAFWNLQKKLRAAEVSTMPLTRSDNTVAFEDDEKAECLAV